jgi:cytochrome c oxidase assembly factor CtaG
VSAPTTQALLTQWNWEPSVLIGLILFSAAYFYLIGPLRERHSLGPPVSRGKQALFVVSMVVVALALLSPLDYVGDEFLFSAHMVQHLLLAAVWPPLLLLSLPDWLPRRIFRQRGITSVATFCTFPAVAIAAFNIDIYLWHLPGLYDLTLQNEGVHILEHLTFMAFGILNWWPVLSPAPEQRLSYPLQVLYLFADGMFMMVLGILFTFAPTVFYSPYVSAPRLWGISALTDQQLGGLIMWYPGNLPYAVWLVIAFYRWFEGDGLTPAEAQSMQSQSPTIGPRVS